MYISINEFSVNLQIHSSVHSINTRNKHNFHRPNGNLTCLQKSAFYVCFKIFNSLSLNLPSLRNKRHDLTWLKKTAKHTHTHLILC